MNFVINGIELLKLEGPYY